MATLCNGENGCGTVSIQDMASGPSYTPTDRVPFTQMTEFMPQMAQNSNVPSDTGVIASMDPISGSISSALQAQTGAETIPGQPDTPASQISQGGSSIIPERILPEAPQFQVPNNPLLPPGYQEVIDYENLQYLNGFLRTQIGKYIRIDQLMGSSMVEDRYGYLVGVGLNYILLQEMGSGNISAIDFYNIKYVYIYHTTTGLPTNGTR